MTANVISSDGRDLGALLTLAVQLAAEAAAVHCTALRREHRVAMKTSATDLVSEVDREAERVLVSALTHTRPHDAILGEEGTNRLGTSGVRWLLDPLDGTRNYLYGYPAFGVSIGVEIDGQRVIGVVNDSSHGHVYTGLVGRSATCDGELISVRPHDELSTAVLGTGFAPNPHERAHQAAVLARVLPQVGDIRRSGSPALDLCAVAAGRIDGFYEVGLREWDMAAGWVIAEAAGAKVVTLSVESGTGLLLVAANPTLITPLLALLAEAGASGPSASIQW